VPPVGQLFLSESVNCLVSGSSPARGAGLYANSNRLILLTLRDGCLDWLPSQDSNLPPAS